LQIEHLKFAIFDLISRIRGSDQEGRSQKRSVQIRPERSSKSVPRGQRGISGTFKAYLFVAAVAFVLAYILYTQRVVSKLRDDARDRVDMVAQFVRFTASEDARDEEISFVFTEVIKKRLNFPVIVTVQGTPEAWRHIGVSMDESTEADLERVKTLANKMDRRNPPIPFKAGPGGEIVGYIHYSDPPIIRQLAWMPFIAIGAIALFIFIGFLGFRNIKNSEQRSIWVGMAKESAHQLGTPLSSLLGWIELMKAELGTSETLAGDKLKDIIEEMEHDVTRMSKIASRFGLIGSIPELKPESLVPIIQDAVLYLESRLPHLGREVHIVQMYEETPPIPANRELLGWAFENLLKNAVDAFEGQLGDSEIRIRTWHGHGTVHVEVSDNGRGIPVADQKRIFSPGYTTKTRGWGLGLTFVKRIIEEYHGGRIVLKHSQVGEGTVFEMKFPTVDR